MRQRTGAELRTARLAAGLTLIQVGVASGISRSELSRIERGDAAWVALTTISRIAAVVGLDVWIRTYPGGEALRDAAHARLESAFLHMVSAPLIARSEVRVGDGRDRRAWDLTLTDPTGDGCGVELETRWVDAQAQHRRIAQKLADGDFDRVLVVVADTRANRAAVRAASGLLGAAYSIDDPAAFEALAAGRVPPQSSLIFVPFPPHGSRRHPKA